MANFEPKKIDLNSINQGIKYINGQIVDASAINAPIEASAWAQKIAEEAKENSEYAKSLGTNTPNIDNINGSGEASVEIENLNDGTARFKFSNLKGEKGDKGDKGEVVGDIPNGGTKGQVLKKTSDLDQEYAWADDETVKVMQETGESETAVMSQKAVTDALKKTSAVVPNPSEVATAELNSLKINDTVYSLPSSENFVHRIKILGTYQGREVNISFELSLSDDSPILFFENLTQIGSYPAEGTFQSTDTDKTWYDIYEIEIQENVLVLKTRLSSGNLYTGLTIGKYLHHLDMTIVAEDKTINIKVDLALASDETANATNIDEVLASGGSLGRGIPATVFYGDMEIDNEVQLVVSQGKIYANVYRNGEVIFNYLVSISENLTAISDTVESIPLEDNVIKNGEVEILQETGESETAVMSQKAVTDALKKTSTGGLEIVRLY